MKKIVDFIKTSSAYQDFLQEIRERIHSAQYEAFKAVNKKMVALYWDIGKRIIEKQEQEGWGKVSKRQATNDLAALVAQKIFHKQGTRGRGTHYVNRSLSGAGIFPDKR